MKPTILMNLLPDVLYPFSHQMRVEIDVSGEKFKDLLHSIEESGQHDPIKARPHPTIKGAYEVGDGNSRILAIKMLSGTSDLVSRTVSALVSDYSDEEMMWLQRDGNEVHQDVTDYERARWMKSMIDDFAYTQVKLADKYRRTQQWVSQQLRMLALETFLSPRTLNRMTEYQARMILENAGEITPDVCAKIEADFKKTGYIPSAQTIKDSVIPYVAMERYTPSIDLGKSAGFIEHEGPVIGGIPALEEGVEAMAPSPMKDVELPVAQIEPDVLKRKPDKAAIEAVLDKFKRSQFDEKTGDLPLIRIRLQALNLTADECDQVIHDHMKRIGLMTTPRPVVPRALDLHKTGEGCPLCGRTINPEQYRRLKAKWEGKTLDDYEAMWKK